MSFTEGPRNTPAKNKEEWSHPPYARKRPSVYESFGTPHALPEQIPAPDSEPTQQEIADVHIKSARTKIEMASPHFLRYLQNDPAYFEHGPAWEDYWHKAYDRFNEVCSLHGEDADICLTSSDFYKTTVAPVLRALALREGPVRQGEIQEPVIKPAKREEKPVKKKIISSHANNNMLRRAMAAVTLFTAAILPPKETSLPPSSPVQRTSPIMPETAPVIPSNISEEEAAEAIDSTPLDPFPVASPVVVGKIEPADAPDGRVAPRRTIVSAPVAGEQVATVGSPVEIGGPQQAIIDGELVEIDASTRLNMEQRALLERKLAEAVNAVMEQVEDSEQR